jgi:phosphoglycolate phosphatase
VTHQRLEANALLIDLDGTLVDATEALVEAAKHAISATALNNVNPQIGIEIARQLQSNLSLDNLLHEIGIVEATKRKFVASYLQAFHDLTLKKTNCIPNVQTTLCKLSKHLPLALVTRRDTSQKMLAKELEHLQLIQYFKAILTSQDVTKPQPSPEILFEAAQRLKMSIRECAFVTDSIVDIQAGKAAGIKTVAVLSGLFSRKELEKWRPDFIVENINCLPGLLSDHSEKRSNS